MHAHRPAVFAALLGLPRAGSRTSPAARGCRVTWPWERRADRRRWRAASTLAEVGLLMADWLEGAVSVRPGYTTGRGPDGDETVATGLAPTLAGCCRAGYVTDTSQPGHPPLPGRDGGLYAQRAFVTGFITDPRLLHRLAAAADAASLLMVRTDRLGRGSAVVPVSVRDGDPCAFVGRHLDQQNLRHQWAGQVGPGAVSHLVRAAQVSLVDPEWGRNRLWPFLNTFMAPGGDR
ncbi:hypothetical protein ABZZ79_29045 [Streptomyces sp. NPDC006458]|uniref:DUF6919 domain-containing protein n=1 Tax=Streptomyces sp. NPDC006458 TaxID=3154302 RepID=UPI0033BDE575